MAEKKIEINVKTSTGYDQLYPKSKADIIDFDNSDTGMQAQNVQSAISEVNNNFNNFVKKTDIVNNLVATITTKPLSANMGRQLNANITALSNKLTSRTVTVRNIGVGVDGAIYVCYIFPLSYDSTPTISNMSGSVSGFSTTNQTTVSIDTARTNQHAVCFKITRKISGGAEDGRAYLCAITFTINE